MKDKKFLVIIGGGIFLFVVLILILVLSTRGGSNTQPANKEQEKKSITLTWWGFEEKEAIEALIKEYQQKNPEIKINYIQKDKNSLERYQNEINEAIANKEAPDIWMIRQDWLPYNYKKLEPIPDSVIKKEDYEKKFFPIVKSTMTIKKDNEEKIYGIPFSVDSLILIYNEKIFREADASLEITTWEDFGKAISDITKRDGKEIELAGAAIGTAYNINYAFDILSLLMLQNGTEMVSENQKEATFNLTNSKDNKNYYPGTAALEFYTSFALPKKKYYTWNNSMKNSQELFIKGKVGMIFGYLEDYWKIKKKAPKLNVGILPMPQTAPDVNINYVRFWANVVSKDSSYREEAWNFLKFCLDKEIINKYYDYKKEKSEAIISSMPEIAENYTNNPENKIIINQAKTAQDWYKGNVLKMEKLFLSMINNVNKGQPAQLSIDSCAKKANTILNQK